MDISTSSADKPYDRVADLLSLQNAVLEAVAIGRELPDALELLCREFERLNAGVVCSVLLLEDKRMRHGAAPSLPDAFVKAIDGSPIGPQAGSCGTAAYTRKAVEVTDIATDPLWQDYRSFALPYGLRACWSSPIFSRDGAILGTFALYFRKHRGPGEFEREAVRVSTPLAAIAIERSRMEASERARQAELAASNTRIEQLNQTLEQRVAERTGDLRQRNAELARAFEELQRTHGQLFEAKKLVSLSHLVVGVAYELNTPLGNARVLSTTMLERCQAFRKSTEAPMRRTDMLQFLADMTEGCEILARSLGNAADRIGRFKAIAVDHSTSSRRRFVLREVVEDVAALFEPVLDRLLCRIELDVPGDIMLDSYPGPLGQVLSNALDNALEHGLKEHDHGVIHIGAARATPSSIEIRIRDNGCGIPPHVIDNVFDAFFTTGLADGYSGLGLHVAHNIVHGLLGGTISIDSSALQGATVVVNIPLTAPTAGRAPYLPN
ncbi:MAG: histidine kinase [Rhodocyclales bacterium]|nr:histidine kinase [Rhodocyclales bacterium]